MVPERNRALLLIVIACGCARQPSAEDLYRDARTLWRRGLFSQATAAADRGWQQWKNQPNTEWHWKFRLLEAELLFNPRSPARALALLERAPVAPPSGELKARYLADLGLARKDSSLLEQALDLASRQGYSSLVPVIELKRAALDGYTERSDVFLRNALSESQLLEDGFLEASALIDLGYERLSASRFDEAIPWFERSESVARRVGGARLREWALGNRGFCYYRMGDFDRAIDSLAQAVT